MHSKLVTLTLALLNLTFLNAQELRGTTWTGIYEPTGDTISIQFSANDTIYLDDSILHVPVAVYELVAGQLNFIDLDGASQCNITPATYQLEIGPDSLRFLAVNDLCETRLKILTEYKWIHAKYGLHKSPPTGDISLYPSRDNMILHIEMPGWFDHSYYKIFRLNQQLMLEGEITRANSDIDISSMSSGNYILYLQANHKTYRVVIDRMRN